MRKLAIMTMLSACLCTYAAENDTTSDGENTYDTTVIVADEKTETDFNFDFPFKPMRDKHKRRNRVALEFNVWINPMFGFVGIVGGDNDARMQMGRSVEFYIPGIIGYELNTGYNTPTVSLAVGFGLQHFLGKSGAAFSQEVADRDYPLNAVPFPDDSYRQSSKINKFAITMPLMVKQRIGGGKVAIGAMLDFNTHLGATTKYRIADSRFENYFGHLSMRPITYEFMGAISSGCIGFYVKYVPVNIFRNGYGPNTKNVSVGMVLGL